jgi:hypothetical protein
MGIKISILFVCCFLFGYKLLAQKKATNLIIITTDGFRWQEQYLGLDTAIANNPKFYEEDSLGIQKEFNGKAVMPFVKNYIGKNGQLWGNRIFENQCAVKNRYWFSYPGYSELLGGFADDSVNSNSYKHNPNTTLLDFFQKQPAYKNQIAAFGAWFAFDRIFNEPRAGFPVFNAFDEYINQKSVIANTINKLNRETYKPFDNEECLDVFTHNMALDYLKTQQPKVLYISYGETDEWAHAGKYKSYLRAARQVDDFIKEIWDYLQSNNFYKNNTVLLITTDHGRGIGDEWTSHNNKVQRSNETWFAIVGKGVKPLGLRKNTGIFYQQQLAQTLAGLLGFEFKCEHSVANAVGINEK